MFGFDAAEEVEARIRRLLDDVTVGGESLSPSARGCKVSGIVDRATPARFADRSGASRTRGNRRTSHHVTVNGGGKRHSVIFDPNRTIGARDTREVIESVDLLLVAKGGVDGLPAVQSLLDTGTVAVAHCCFASTKQESHSLIGAQ